MNTRTLSARTRTLALLSLCAVSLFTTACERTPSTEPETRTPNQTDEAAPEHVRSYTVRGQVVLVPDPDNPATELQIRHEHIPDFHGWDGALHINDDGVPGMKAMTMPFPVDDPAVIQGVKAGDRVEFTFSVDTEARRYWITSVTPLGDDAVLDYADKAPPVDPDDGP